VNGETVELPQTMVDGKKDTVVVDGRPLNTVSTHLYYFAVNKPKGCATLNPDPI
jgi:16S rRNA U516 pseudouridylate synthase RsuA-like enzyme